jgi:hypothetical protein
LAAVHTRLSIKYTKINPIPMSSTFEPSTWSLPNESASAR